MRITNPRLSGNYIQNDPIGWIDIVTEAGSLHDIKVYANADFKMYAALRRDANPDFQADVDAELPSIFPSIPGRIKNHVLKQQRERLEEDERRGQPTK
jgi:hypothetical protein